MGSSAQERSPDASSSVRIEEEQQQQQQHQDVALQSLKTSSLLQLLDMDNRPTFVLNTNIYAKGGTSQIKPVFCNSSLRKQEVLLSKVTGAVSGDCDSSDGGATHDEFRIWATVISRFEDSRDIFPATIKYASLVWTSFGIQPNWKIICGHEIFSNEGISGKEPLVASAMEVERHGSGALKEDTKKALASAEAIPTEELILDVKELECPPAPFGPDLESSRTSSVSAVTLTTPDSCVPDWTVPDPGGILSDHLQFVRSIDWGKTPLGAMDRWSIQFREIICLVMRNPHPSSVFWGEDLTMLYNEAYRDDVTGDKHPALMGTGFSGPFSEMWHAVGPIIRECARTGHAQHNHNQPLPIMRYGYMEEAFFTWSFVPVFGGTERVLGFYLSAFDTTVESISSRRMQLLRYLGERMNATRTVKEFWGRVLEGLNHNDYDVPFALLYSIVDTEETDIISPNSYDSSPGSTKACLIEGSIGVPRGHQACPDRFVLTESDDPLISALREAMRTLEPGMLSVKDGTLPKSLLEIVEWRGYKDPCREAMILPLRPTNADNVCALLLLGINPRRAYDQEYKTFTAMLNRQIATSLASVLLFEDEVRRSKHAAEVATLQREQLSQQLQLQNIRMRRMTEFSHLGMYLFDPEGRLLEANDRYYEMTGVSHKDCGKPWSLDVMVGASRKAAQEMWDYVTKKHKPASCELQFANSRCQPKDIDGKPIEYWVLATSQPEISPDGKLISVMGSITDISHLKWAQGLQEQRLREAEESKRQQNEFIDITSHEMRNPLSAIVICADDIRDTLSQHKFSSDADLKIAKDCIEAANNIAICVQHQKSIVDDILTVSKLDSNLLRITPVPSQPIIVVQRSMAMFRREILAKNIEFKFAPHPSLRELDIDWVVLDSGRLLQIIVNLITNSIKFTQDRPVRCITVQVGAHLDRSDIEIPEGFEFVPQRITVADFGSGDGWGTGSQIYLRFQVQDTGCGLTPEQKQMLFEKFAQESPRTHGKYGGSGLGLFISRQLAELHGGQIGCSSKAGVGSTFGFYLKCKRMIPQKRTLAEEIVKQPSEVENAVASGKVIAAPPKLEKKHIEVTVTSLSSDKEDTKDGRLHVLVVEDNPVNQKVLCKQLTKAGCIVSTADHGLWALKHLAKTHFCAANGIPLDIVLMDCEMPEMDGLTCCSKIREMEQHNEVTRHVPIIAVTANIRGGQIDDANNAGMDDIIGKPFSIPDLLSKMKGLLKKLEDGRSIVISRDRVDSHLR